MYDCVIFDIDGTLIDTEKAIIGSLQKVLLEELGKHYDYNDLVFTFGIPGAVSLEKFGIKNIEATCRRWNSYIEEFRTEMRIYPGIEEVLRKLDQKRIKNGIVTSKTKEEFKKHFIPLGLADYFKYVVCADDTTKYKPEPEPLLKFMELFNVSPDNSIYIGDTIYDLRCAQGAKIDFGLALWGAKQPESINAQYKLKQPREILDIVQR